MSTRIAVSLRGQMRALASQGIFATDCYEQLKSILLQKLGALIDVMQEFLPLHICLKLQALNMLLSQY